MDLDNKLRKLEDSIDEYSINVCETNYLHIPIRLACINLKGYQKLIIELNRARKSCKTFAEKELFVEKYKKVYLSQRKKYQCILRNLINGTAKILCFEVQKDAVEYIYRTLELSGKFDKSFGENFDRDKSFGENLTNYMKAKLKQRIRETNQELYILKSHSVAHINTLSIFIYPYSVSKYRENIIFYRDVFIAASDSHGYSVFFNENTPEDTKNALLSILAYFNGCPYFYCTENYDFNKKLCDLYEQFDLLDILRLRKKNFFDSKQKEPFYLEIPILKTKNSYDIVCFEDSQHEMVFELYHASLKQFEPLSRCVFLYRVFEYGAAYHYKPLMHPPHYSPEDALNYYADEIMSHKYNPLYYVDFGTYVSEDGNEIIKKRKAKYINFIVKLQEEAKKIKREWSIHPYLRNKNIGSIIYKTGRNASAHGGSGRENARYDYSMNYKHINDVNIFLELIARYIIEKLNPQLNNMVERRIKYYIKYNNYEKIFGLDKSESSIIDLN